MTPIYVHAKLALIDDRIMVNGSTNMDNMSFFYCSEVSAVVYKPSLVKETRCRLMSEHLGSFWRPEMENDPVMALKEFQRVADSNAEAMKVGSALKGRIV